MGVGGTQVHLLARQVQFGFDAAHHDLGHFGRDDQRVGTDHHAEVTRDAERDRLDLDVVMCAGRGLAVAVAESRKRHRSELPPGGVIALGVERGVSRARPKPASMSPRTTTLLCSDSRRRAEVSAPYADDTYGR